MVLPFQKCWLSKVLDPLSQSIMNDPELTNISKTNSLKFQPAVMTHLPAFHF